MKRGDFLIEADFKYWTPWYSWWQKLFKENISTLSGWKFRQMMQVILTEWVFVSKHSETSPLFNIFINNVHCPVISFHCCCIILVYKCLDLVCWFRILACFLHVACEFTAWLRADSFWVLYTNGLWCSLFLIPPLLTSSCFHFMFPCVWSVFVLLKGSFRSLQVTEFSLFTFIFSPPFGGVYFCVLIFGGLV